MIKRRRLNLKCSYDEYVKDAEKEGAPYYKSRSRFYYNRRQKGIKDTRMVPEAGACPNCVRYGEQTWGKLNNLADNIVREVRKDIVEGTGFDRAAWGIKLESCENYFKRGASFQRKLRMIPACIHHCVSCSLSDPNDEDYCSAADHEHVSVDTMSADRDDLWDQLAELVNASIESELTKAGEPDEVIVTLVEQPKSLSGV